MSEVLILILIKNNFVIKNIKKKVAWFFESNCYIILQKIINYLFIQIHQLLNQLIIIPSIIIININLKINLAII